MITAEKFNQSIAALMRHERKCKGMSMQTLGDIMGVSCQQIQKYEKAINALSAYKLLQVAAALEISAEDFINQAIKGRRKLNHKLK
jgi:transcriptional regulator with XRE-family HTH domain